MNTSGGSIMCSTEQRCYKFGLRHWLTARNRYAAAPIERAVTLELLKDLSHGYIGARA